MALRRYRGLVDAILCEAEHDDLPF
jgi:hypothetical protein